MMEQISVKSKRRFMVLNGCFAIFRPWHLEVDVENRLLTVRRRNWHLISVDEEVLRFTSIRSVKVDRHFLGANLMIKVPSGKIEVLYLSKKDARRIANLLLNR